MIGELLREIFKAEPPPTKGPHQEEPDQMDEDSASGNDQSN
jgi:hypothetical protein